MGRYSILDRTRPDFEPGGGLWAPDINKIGDTYVLYYSMSKWEVSGPVVSVALRQTNFRGHLKTMV